MQIIERGSEWRRWDLHIHTPGTVKNDNFQGRTLEEKWNYFYNTIDNYIGDGTDPLKTISAIAITDYLSIDNYLRVRNDKRLPSSVKLLLPNVELRVSPIASKSPLNIHCIFSDSIVDMLETDFFAKLEFTYDKTTYNATRNGLINFGEAYNKTLGKEDDALSIGTEQFIINIDKLKTIFENNSELRNNTIIVVSNKSCDGASGISDHYKNPNNNQSQLDATRQEVYRFADMIFSSSEQDIKYFLGEKNDDATTIIRKYGSLKPCIHGSDAHSNPRLFEPDQQRYCWIKADLTFDGLKQLLYEPKSRVRISPSYPEPKPPYQVIDYVEITDNPDFSSKRIYLSENLTCIIGGKSTGKSLLLHNIALALDKEQVLDKTKISTTNVRNIEGVNIVWRDNKEISRKIIYIPQTYLNRLSDGKEESSEIDKIIEEVILQNEEIKKSYEEMRQNIHNYKLELTKKIINLCELYSEKNNTLKKQKEVGDKEGIEKEITRLSSLLEEKSKEHNLTDDEIKQYQNACETINNINKRIETLQKEHTSIMQTEQVVKKRDNILNNITFFYEDISKIIENIEQNANYSWQEEKEKITTKITLEINSLKEKLEIYKKQENELKPKIESNQQIKDISNQVNNEKDKLRIFEEITNQLSTIENMYIDKLNTIANSFNTFHSFYTNYIQTVKSQLSNNQDLKFSVNCILRTQTLSETITQHIDKRSKTYFTQFNIQDIKDGDITQANLKELVNSLLSASSDSLKLKRDSDVEEVLLSIFSDCYNLRYSVIMDNDEIEKMSPGKKALVLLRLLIELADSKWPILIDQPEDDLDNRSIFNELIPFIKTKKQERQIIIVTHNANVVLGGDAELVIVANQEGKNSKNHKYKFEYRGGSIENNVPIKDDKENILNGILYEKGIQTHICEIMEGGEQAFDLRKKKYDL